MDRKSVSLPDRDAKVGLGSEKWAGSNHCSSAWGPRSRSFFFKVWMSIEFLGYENGLVFDFCLGFVTSLFYSIIYIYYIMLCYVIFVFQVPFRLQCLLGKSNRMTAVFFGWYFPTPVKGVVSVPVGSLKTPFVPTFLMNFFRTQIGGVFVEVQLWG